MVEAQKGRDFSFAAELKGNTRSKREASQGHTVGLGGIGDQETFDVIQASSNSSAKIIALQHLILPTGKPHSLTHSSGKHKAPINATRREDLHSRRRTREHCEMRPNKYLLFS